MEKNQNLFVIVFYDIYVQRYLTMLHFFQLLVSFNKLLGNVNLPLQKTKKRNITNGKQKRKGNKKNDREKWCSKFDKNCKIYIFFCQ